MKLMFWAPEAPKTHQFHNTFQSLSHYLVGQGPPTSRGDGVVRLGSPGLEGDWDLLNLVVDARV